MNLSSLFFVAALVFSKIMVNARQTILCLILLSFFCNDQKKNKVLRRTVSVLQFSWKRYANVLYALLY